MYVFKKLINENSSHDNFELVLTSKSVCLDNVIEDLELFLRGCGYHFDGKLQIVEE